MYYHLQVRTAGNGVRYNTAIKHIQYWREVQFSAVYAYLCNISSPFLIGSVCAKITFQYIRSNLAYFPLVGMIVPFLCLCLKSHLIHQFLYCLVINNYIFTLAQFHTDSSVPIASMILVIYLLYTFSDSVISITVIHMRQVVIEYRTSHLHPMQHKLQRMSLMP